MWGEEKAAEISFRRFMIDQNGYTAALDLSKWGMDDDDKEMLVMIRMA